MKEVREPQVSQIKDTGLLPKSSTRIVSHPRVLVSIMSDSLLSKQSLEERVALSLMAKELQLKLCILEIFSSTSATQPVE